MPNKMLIDASHPEETRVVVTRGNRIEEFDFESQDKKQLRGNIYLARVTRVEPSLQAAFVEYGGNRHGFLAFSEIHPDYYQIPVADRQALLRAEAQAAQDEEDEDEEQRGERSRASNGKRRRRGRKPPRNDEAAKADAANADGDDAVAEAGHSDGGESNDQDATVDSAENDVEGGTPAIAADVAADVISEPVTGRDGDDERADAEGEKPEDQVESVGAGDAMDEVRDRRRPPRRHYKIQEVVKRRQILLVQVVKEERGNKGAALTTYLSLAGRYSVLMPNTARGGGISRKITSAQDRKRLKDVVKDLEVPQGMGVILRTAGENRTKAEIKRDYEYLMRLWENVRNLTLKSTAPSLVYEEGSLIKRSVRDLYNKDIEEILVAGEEGYREAKDFMRMLMPSHAKMVQPYRDTTPIFARSGIDAQLDRMVQPQVTLKSGGYIIINQTEALVSIDVNSGRSTREHSIEDTALQTNLEAADEVARQLRLRDLAGLIVIDFIDMEEGRNNRAVEKKIKDCLKNDRARIQVGRISHFGLLEMSRQRIRASVLESTMKTCPHCGGTGHIRSDSSVALLVVRAIEEFLLKDNRHHITVRTPIATALYVLNHKRGTLVSLEAKFGVTITIEADDSVGSQHHAISRGAAVENPITVVEAQPLPVIEDNDDDIEDVVDEDEAENDEAASEPARSGESAQGDNAQDGQRKRKRRRRRRGGRDREQQIAADGSETVQDEDAADAASGTEDAAEGENQEAASSDEQSKKRRRGKRGGRRNREAGDEATEASPVTGEDGADTAEPLTAEVVAAEPDTALVEAVEEKPKPARKPRRSSKAAKAAEAEAAPVVEELPAAEPVAATAEVMPKADAPAPRRSSRRAAAPSTEPVAPKVSSTVPSDTEAAPPKKGWWQRKGFF